MSELAFERRISDFEERILSIESKISNINRVGDNPLNDNSNKASDSTEVIILTNQRDDLLSENSLLKKEIERLHYRVNHLIKSLNAEEMKNSSL